MHARPPAEARKRGPNRGQQKGAERACLCQTPDLVPSSRWGPTEPAKVSKDSRWGDMGCRPPVGLSLAQLRCGADGKAGKSRMSVRSETLRRKKQTKQNENKQTSKRFDFLHEAASDGSAVSRGLFIVQLLSVLGSSAVLLYSTTSSSISSELEEDIPLNN